MRKPVLVVYDTDGGMSAQVDPNLPLPDVALLAAVVLRVAARLGVPTDDVLALDKRLRTNERRVPPPFILSGGSDG